MTTNSGRHFIVVFLEHLVPVSEINIHVTTVGPDKASVEVSAPLIPSIQSTLRIVVVPDLPANVSLHKNVSLEGTGRGENGVLITSDQDITIQCVSSAKGERSVDGYMAFPTNALGNKYLIPTYCERNSCILGIVGTGFPSVVKISLKLPPNKTLQFDGETYGNSDTISVMMRKYQTVQITSSVSLTGTYVQCDVPIAVFVGSDYTSVTGFSLDHMVEQLQPLDFLGMDYLLIPFPHRVSFDVVVVVAQFPNTSVRYSNYLHPIAEAGGSITIYLPSTMPSLLSSDKRITVMQISNSFSTDPEYREEYYEYPNNYTDTEYQDPCMLLVPPIEQWIPLYSFSSPTVMSDSKSVVLALAASTNCAPLLTLTIRGIQVDLKWTEIAGTQHSVSYATLEEKGPYIVNSTSSDATCSALGGYIYGPALHSAWVMSIGQSFKPLPDVSAAGVFLPFRYY